MLSTKDKIRAVQRALGTAPDGSPGPHTWDVLYRQFASPGMPYEGKFFGCYCIIGDPDKLQLIDGYGVKNVSDYNYSMSGSFTAPSGVSPISIMVNDYKTIRFESCHAPSWDGGLPETVLCYKDGRNWMELVTYVSQLSELPKWAVGGMQLIRDGSKQFNNIAEGFTGRFSDVLRRTYHTCIGFDKYGNVIGVYGYGTARQMQDKCYNIGLVNAIMLDGGHLAAVNTPAYMKNIKQRQGYIIKF